MPTGHGIDFLQAILQTRPEIAVDRVGTGRESARIYISEPLSAPLLSALKLNNLVLDNLVRPGRELGLVSQLVHLGASLHNSRLDYFLGVVPSGDSMTGQNPKAYI